MTILTCELPASLQTLNALKFVKGQYIIVISDIVVEQHERAKAKRKLRINPDCLQWRPPQFTRQQLAFVSLRSYQLYFEGNTLIMYNSGLLIFPRLVKLNF